LRFSWHKNNFYWDKDKNQPTGVKDDQVVEKPDQTDNGWKCFWIKESLMKLKVTGCNHKKRYVCEKEGMLRTDFFFWKRWGNSAEMMNSVVPDSRYSKTL